MRQKNKNCLTVPSANYLPRIIGLGELDLTYSLELSEDDLKTIGVEDINNINSIEDLQCIVNAPNLWGNIEISSNNFTLNCLLNITKMAQGEVFAEYIAFDFPTFNESQKAFEKMLEDINGANYILINKSKIVPSSYQITFLLKEGDNNVKEIQLVSKDEENKDAPNSKGENVDERKEEEKEDPNSNYIKIDNADSPLNKVKLTCDKYEYFIMSIEDAQKIEPFSDCIELLTYFKTKSNSNIIIKYTDITGSFESKEQMIELNRFYFLTDTFFMNLNDAIRNFNSHYNFFCKSENSQITAKNINEYFINTIACKGQLSLFYSKILYLIDDLFSNLTIIEVSNNARPTNLTYTVKPYPQVNVKNVDMINEYKYMLRNNYHFYEAIFFSGILSQFIFNKDKKTFEILYRSYLNGLEILKKILEYDFKCIPIPNNRNFYKVKLNKEHIDSMVKKAEIGEKENKFVLDCTNLEKSAMKYYVPLFDKDLHEYFKSDFIQKELKDKGFINSKGFVNYDPYYKKEMYKAKRKVPTSLSLNDKEIRRNFVKDLKKREKLESKKFMLNSIEPTKVRLPVEDCYALNKYKELNKKMNKYKCKHTVKHKECQYCYLKGLSIQAENIEEKKKRSMQLRRYN